MNKEGIYIIDSKGDSTYFSPPDSGFGEIQIQYCNSVPIMLREKNIKISRNEKIEGCKLVKGSRQLNANFVR